MPEMKYRVTNDSKLEDGFVQRRMGWSMNLDLQIRVYTTQTSHTTLGNSSPHSRLQ